MSVYEVVIRVKTDDDELHPALWNWRDLLDTGNPVEVVSADEIDYEIEEAENGA